MYVARIKEVCMGYKRYVWGQDIRGMYVASMRYVCGQDI